LCDSHRSVEHSQSITDYSAFHTTCPVECPELVSGTP